MLGDLRKAGVAQIKVRSPLTCEADHPPCQLCAGYSANGKPHPIGANIGTLCGQETTERSTQLVMKMFHSGGSVGSGDSITAGFSRLNELLTLPDVIKDQGEIALETGTIKSVEVAPQGGHDLVLVDDTNNKKHKYYIMPNRKVLVKAGDKVKAGQPLSDGNYKPQDIAMTRGLFEAQKYMVDNARQAYANSKATVRKPVLEVVVAGIMRYVRITDDGGEKDLLVGDVLPENVAIKRQKQNSNIAFEPAALGIKQKPLQTSLDMLSRLNFQRLPETLRDVPAMGGSSDLTGKRSPIAGMAYGANFRPGDFPALSGD
jgi:DNA-directed RNA polymerase subunit beta'